MNDRFSLKDHDEQRPKAEQHVSSDNTEEVLRAFWKLEDRNDGNSAGPSKYSKVLSCYFVKGPKETIPLKTIEAEKS